MTEPMIEAEALVKELALQLEKEGYAGLGIADDEEAA